MIRQKASFHQLSLTLVFSIFHIDLAQSLGQLSPPNFPRSLQSRRCVFKSCFVSNCNDMQDSHINEFVAVHLFAFLADLGLFFIANLQKIVTKKQVVCHERPASVCTGIAGVRPTNRKTKRLTSSHMS